MDLTCCYSTSPRCSILVNTVPPSSWQLPIRTRINFFSDLCYSNSVGLVKLTLTPHAHQWALDTHDPVTSSPAVHSWITFGGYLPLHTFPFRTIAYWEQDLPFWRCLIWPLSKSLRSLLLPISPSSNTATKMDLSFAAKYIPALDRCHCNEMIIVINCICQWF